MSQNAATHGPHARPGDEDLADPGARRPGRPGQHVREPDDDRGARPDEPEDSEFELTGDNDLSAADLGPAAPDFTDPDARSGRPRKLPDASQ